MENNTTTLTETYKNIDNLNNHLDQLTKEYNNKKLDLDNELARLKNIKEQLLANLDTNKIETAYKLLEVKGIDNQYGDYKEVIKDARNEFIYNKGKRLVGEHIGTKNYDSWRGQYVGFVLKGYGPRHGSICFSISLRGREEVCLSDEQIEAIIYTLDNLANPIVKERFNLKGKN